MAIAVLTDLRQRHRGPVIAVDDAGYDPARITFNGMIDRRPELIVRPLDVDDVVSAVSFGLVMTRPAQREADFAPSCAKSLFRSSIVRKRAVWSTANPQRSPDMGAINQ